VAERVTTTFRSLADLKKIGVIVARAAGFISLGGKRLQDVRWASQISLWDEGNEVGSRHHAYAFSPGTFR
jgi:hypothetical protein